MSGTDHAPSDEHDADTHDDHDDHGEPPPPEPASPAWLPLLGAGLFLGGLLWFLISNSPGAEADAEGSHDHEHPAANAKAAPVAAAPGSARPNRLPLVGGNKLKEALDVGAGRKQPGAMAPPPPPPAPPPPPPPPPPAPHPAHPGHPHP